MVVAKKTFVVNLSVASTVNIRQWLTQDPTKHPIQTNTQVRLRAQLKLGVNLNKGKEVINFWRNFGNYFLIFVNNLFFWHFLSIYIFSFFPRFSEVPSANKRLAKSFYF